MSGYSRKILRDGVERLIQKGVGKITPDDLDIPDLLHNLAKSARSTTVATESHLEEVKDRAKNLGEAALSIAKSVESFSDLEERFKAHRGEIVIAAKTFSEQLREVFTHLAEPLEPKDRSGFEPSSDLAPKSDLAGEATSPNHDHEI